MAFVRMLQTLLRDKKIGQHIVPIVPDEARTFGMEGMFRQLGIYSADRPEDAAGRRPADLLQGRHKGQILEEGINEAGAMCSWIAAATSYTNHGVSLIPFYIFYSMFGFQRIGDLAWAAGDMRARGFLLGGTAGRTTLNGEGLQHEDGHSHLAAAISSMRLRSDIGEVEEVLADWWQEFSMADDNLRQDLVDLVREEQQRRQRAPRVVRVPRVDAPQVAGGAGAAGQGNAASTAGRAPAEFVAGDGGEGDAGAPRKRRRRRRTGAAKGAGGSEGGGGESAN